MPRPSKTPDLGPRYAFLRTLGSGGLGEVHLVRDGHLGKDLALKLIHHPPGIDEENQEVQREFTLLSQLEHPGLARAFDFGYLGGRPYFTSEFIPGEPPGARDSPPPLGQIIKLAREIAEAVRFLHQNHILHLDIKPANMILRQGTGDERAVLIDFGLCRRGAPKEPGVRLRGSLPYMAPEYFRGEPLGPWTDIYALGVTLYRLATGRFPRPGASGEKNGLSDREAWDPAPPPPSRISPSIPRDLDSIILRCLALDPRSRYASGAELLLALEALGPPAVARTPAGASTLTIGREAELARVDRLLDRLTHRSVGPRAVLITGQPGMGQSHFLREVKRRAQTRGIHAYLESAYAGRPGLPGAHLACLTSHVGSAGGEERFRWEQFLGRIRRPRRPARIETSEGERRLRHAAEVALAARAVSEPVLCLFDDLQFSDEISLGLIIDLLRFLGEPGEGQRAPIGVLAGCREEGHAVGLLRELSENVLKDGRGEAIALRPLGLEETRELYRIRRGIAAGSEAPGKHLSTLDLFTRTGGVPKAIVDLASAEMAPERGTFAPAAASAEGSIAAPVRAAPDAGDGELIHALNLIGRPVSVKEISKVLGIAPRSIHARLAKLAGRGLVIGPDPDGGRSGWLPDPGAGRLFSPQTAIERRRAHLRIARALCPRRVEDPAIVEAVRHFARAGKSSDVVRHGLPAARYLKSTFQNRAALDLLDAVLAVLPPRRFKLRLEIALEMAELEAQAGSPEEGIHRLQEFLSRLRDLPPAARRRTLLYLATLHVRRGEFQRADGLFREVLPEARRRGSGISGEDLLFFINEHATIKAFRGEYGPALSLCEEGLRLAGEDRAFPVREVVLNLHATRANVHLRTFDFPAAIGEFEKALEIAEAIVSPVNQAVVLSNLGIVYSQCDRYEPAIRAFQEAERICLGLDEGPSLVSIYGNLAITHSKLGDFEASGRALREGEKLNPAGIGPRQRLFLHHARGVCLLGRGRFAEAQVHLETAIRLGESMGDLHVVAFDEVYRAECLLFRGSYSAAADELARLMRSSFAPRARRMAFARLALLRAFTGREKEMAAAVGEHQEPPGKPEIPFLDAWDGLFIGWALSIAGDFEAARVHLAGARNFFLRHRLTPGLSLARWVSAESRLLAGDLEGAREALSTSGAPGNDFTRVLWPLLAARLALEEPEGPRRGTSPMDLLAEAGAAMVGNRLIEWEARLNALRELFQGASPARGPSEARGRRPPSRDLPDEERRGQRAGRYFQAWVPARGIRKPKTPARTDSRRGGGPPANLEGTEPITPRNPTASRPGLVLRSPAMKRLAKLLDRLKTVDLPVLIQGETGTGKELIARTIHRESRRAGGPFIVLDCAAIPPGLLDLELFGAQAGTFTDLKKDRRGLLSLAAGGTIFIDEVAGIPADLQAKLLRAISEKTMRPLGMEVEEPIDARFLFSTARDLKTEAEEGRLRKDLFHRIQGLEVTVPPLRERGEDLPELIDLFLREGGLEPPEVGRRAVERLAAYRWPGNVRELRNLLLRLRLEKPRRIGKEEIDRILADPETTTLFPRNILGREDLPSLKDRLEREYLLHHLRRLSGDTRALREFLGLGPRQLYRRLDPHSALPDGDFAGWQVVMPTSLQSFAQCRRDAHFV